MEILVYSDLFVEVKKPLLRASWLDYFLKVVVRNLANTYRAERANVRVKCIGNSQLVTHLKSKQFEDVEFHCISDSQLHEIFKDHEESLSLYKSKDERGLALAKLIQTQLGSDYSPDLILSLTSSDWLRNVYEAPNIFYEAGLFSRTPFPALTQWDPSEDHWKSGFVWKYGRYLSSLDDVGLDEARKGVLTRLRDHYKTFIAKRGVSRTSFDPDNRFDSVVLLPLQYSKCIAFDSCCEYTSQLDFLHDVLSKIDPKIGVIVTTHNYYENPISNRVDRDLRERYPNYIRNKFCETEEAASQFILPFVDGVVGVSTAVCLQALFWGKPTFIVGNSYMRAFSDGDLETLNRGLKGRVFKNRDASLYWLLTRYYMPLRNCISGSFLRSHLENLISLERGVISIDEFKAPASEGEILNVLFDAFDLKGFEQDPDAHRFKGEQIFYRAVLDHELISFDVFDTLLVRPFSKPAHLFALMQDDVDQLLGKSSPTCFMTERVFAEVDIARKISRLEDVTLDEIYEALSEHLGISDETAEAIKRLEIETEIRLIKPREFVKKIVEFAALCEKKIILASDMYLPGEEIRRLLKGAGYAAHYELYLSCELMKTKSTGTLFDYILQKEGVTPNKVLHIGDNRHADIAMARSKGIRALYTPKPMDRFLQYPVFRRNFAKSINVSTTRDYWHNFMPNSVVAGLFANRLGENPYDIHRTFDGQPDYQSVSCGSARRLGYFFGPMFLGFTNWVISKLKFASVEHVLFLSRDGHLPFLIYQKIRETDRSLPPASYIYCSRRLLGLASIRDKDDIFEVLRSSSFKEAMVCQLLEKRFGVSRNEVSTSQFVAAGFSGPYDKVRQDYMARIDQRLVSLVESIASLILERAEVARKSLEAHLLQEGINRNAKLGVVDVGCSTVMQHYLEKSLCLPKRTFGCYFITNHRAFNLRRLGIDSVGYVADLEDQNCDSTPYFNNIEFFETIFSAPHGSVLDLYHDGEGRVVPLFMDDRCYNKNELVGDLHAGAMDFVHDYLSVFRDKLDLTFMSKRMSTNFVFDFVDNPGGYDALVFEGVEFENDYGGHANVSLIAPLGTNSSNLSLEFEKKSIWKAGVRSIETTLANRKGGDKSAAQKSAVGVLASAAKTSVGGDSTGDVKTIRSKKLAKFKRSPHNFFRDSKYPLLRVLRHAVPKGVRFN